MLTLTRARLSIWLALLLNALAAHAQDAQSIYRQASESVYLVEARGPKGNFQGSAVAYANSQAASPTDPTSWEKAVKNGTYFATNFHVIDGASTITLRRGNRQFTARLDFGDEAMDFALLHIAGEVITPAERGNYADIQIGDRVYAIGSPLGLENSLSDGLVAGKRVQDGIPLIQTTAAISRGNSGGGLFDKTGKLLGITTFKLAGGENLNFAIDIGIVDKINGAYVAAEGLRAMFADRLTPGQKQRLATSQFVKWLLKVGRANVPTYEEVDEIMQMTGRGKLRATEGMAALERIVNAFLASNSPNAAQAANAPRGDGSKLLILVCRMRQTSSGTSLGSITLYVDLVEKSVNDRPATISDAAITWQSPDKNTRFVLDRMSGDFSLARDNSPNRSVGECSRTEQKRF